MRRLIRALAIAIDEAQIVEHVGASEVVLRLDDTPGFRIVRAVADLEDDTTSTRGVDHVVHTAAAGGDFDGFGVEGGGGAGGEDGPVVEGVGAVVYEGEGLCECRKQVPQG